MRVLTDIRKFWGCPLRFSSGSGYPLQVLTPARPWFRAFHYYPSAMLLGILLLLQPGSICYAQKQGAALIDSLRTELPHISNDSLKVRTLKRMADESFFFDTRQAMQFGKQGLSEAQRMNWPRAIGTFYSILARGYSDQGLYDSCHYYNRMALRIQSRSGDRFNAAVTLNNMAAAEQNLKADFLKATRYYFGALRLAGQLQDESLTALCYDNLSGIYFAQSNFRKSLAYAFKSLEIRRKLSVSQPGDSNAGRDLGHSYAKIGSCYVEMKDIKRTELYYQKALPLLEQAGDFPALAEAYSNLAIGAGADSKKKIAYGKRAETLWNEVNLMHSLAINHLGNMGAGYLDMARYDSLRPSGLSREAALSLSEEYLLEAIRRGEQLGNVSLLSFFRGNLAEAQALKGDYRNAYFNFRAYQGVQDSLFSQENKNAIAALEGKKEVELRDAQLHLNQLELASRKRGQMFMLAGLVLIAAIAILLVRQNFVRKRNNSALQKLNDELDAANRLKARFFAILSHDLRSPVANLISFLNIQNEAPELLSPEVSARHQQHIRQSAENLLSNMEAMLLWSKQQLDKFEPQFRKVAVPELFDYLDRFFSDQDRVEIRFADATGLTLLSDEDYLRTIMQNLTANAIKAVAGSPDPRVSWEAVAEAGKIVLVLCDNGPGIDVSQAEILFSDKTPDGGTSGLGLHLVRDLSKAINCAIHYSSRPGEGSEFRLEMVQGNEG